MELKAIQIELCGVCNATCSYCTWNKKTIGKTRMDVDLAKNLLDQAKAMGVERVIYHGLGESTLHPDLVDIIAHGDRLGFDNTVSTNCFKLDGKVANGLKDIKSLNVILAVPWVMHDKFVQRSIKNAKDYISSRPKNKSVLVQMVCHSSAKKYYNQLMSEFYEIVSRTENVEIFLKHPLTWYNDDDPNYGFEIDVILDSDKNIRVARFDTPVSIGRHCKTPERFLMITSAGNVMPCCIGIDEWGLPNVKDSSLAEIWRSADMADIRDKWKNADDSIPCGQCIKRKDC